MRLAKTGLAEGLNKEFETDNSKQRQSSERQEEEAAARCQRGQRGRRSSDCLKP